MKRVILLTLVLIINLVADDNKTAQQKLDPVYKLELDKYPKFSTELILKSGKKIKFSSVKSMINFYFHPEKYPEYGVGNRSEIDKMYVHDYLDGTRVDARKAWYVFGSRIVGPHGDDLIPFKSKSQAELFVKKYGGSRIMDADAVTFGLIHYLDM